MCQRVTCRKCNKPSYSGCGAHIEQVLGDVPRDKRCHCREAAAAEKAQKKASGATSDASPSWFQKLFG